MNTQNGTPVNIGIDTSQDQLDIFVRPSGEFFSVPNSPQGATEAAKAIRAFPVCQPDPIHSPFGINYISGPQILDSQHAKINIRAARHTGYT